MPKKQISSLSIVLNATVAPFVGAFGKVFKTLSSFTSSITSASGSILKFTGIAGGIGAALAVFGGAKDAIGLAASLEQTQVAFETLLGSAGAASAMMQNLKTFAAETPFEFPELASSAKMLASFGINTAEIIPTMKSLGDVASGVGMSITELAEIYGKNMVQGRLMAADVNQLTARGIPIIGELAKQFGVAESAVRDLVSEGKVTSQHMQIAFQSMAGEGGKFGGMMAKQSQTLSGLWSTLSDNVSMTLADLTTTIFNAFNIKGAIASVASGIGSIGATITGFVTTYVPLAINFGAMVWDSIAGVFSRIYGYVAPIISGIGAFIAANWQATVSTTVAFYTSIWGLLSSLFNVIWGGVSWLWNGVVGVWDWACGLVGASTTSTGSTVSSVFQRIVDFGRWMQNGIIAVVQVVSYVINNLGLTFALAGYEIALFCVRTGNQIGHIFTEVIPSLLSWFWNNWRDIFTTMMDFTASVFVNMYSNVKNFFSAVWSFLSGDGFSFEWTSLTSGFESSIKELPKIAEREIGGLEASLQNTTDGLRNQFANGLAEYMDGQKKTTEGIIGGAKDAAGAVAQAFTPPTALAEVKMPAIDTAAPVASIQGVTAAVTELKNSMSVVGSAQASLDRYKAMLDRTTAATGGALASSPASTASAAPRPAPLPASVQRDVQKASGNDDVSALLKQVVALLTNGNGELATIATNTATGGESDTVYKL